MKLGLTTALQVILAQRLWQAGSGVITIVMITSFLTPAQQGWYFSLLSLSALYTLFDMGLSFVLVQAAAHEFVGLRWRADGQVEGGNAERFAAVTAWAARHYLWLTLGFAFIITPAGMLFFSTTPAAGISWTLPWLVLAAASAAALLVLPFMAVVEGSGEVREVYVVRLIQGIVAGLATWLAFLCGAGLWAVVMTPLATIAVQGLWLARWKPNLLKLARHGPHRLIRWRQEIWPHQWQLGLGWVCGYLLTQIYTPVLFKVQDAVVAGQMGLTMTASNMLGLLALSWITRHVPAMAKAVAMREWTLFDALCRRDLLWSCMAFVAGAIALCGLHRLLSLTPYADRVLPFWLFAGVLLSGFLGHVQNALGAQLRSFRREPLIWVSLTGAILMATGAVWGAVHYSATGVVAALLATQALVILPASILIWWKSITRWKTSPPATAAALPSDVELGIVSHLDA